MRYFGRQNLAAALRTELQNISVKATTEEHLGFTGDGSGIAAGLAAAAVATTVAGAAMLANDRENAGDGSE